MRRLAATTVFTFLALLGQFIVAGPAAALALPSGFQLVDSPTGQPAYNLTNFAWLEDGGLLTSGKDGTITYVPPGGGPRVLTKVAPVRALGDHGFLGFALGNDYASTGRVYVSYDKGDPDGTGFGMVEEWKVNPVANPTTFTRSRTLLDGSAMSPRLSQNTNVHGIDTVLVAPDDTLFVSIGDDAENNGDPRTLRAQDLDQPYGKVLHLTPGGQGVPTNPQYSAAAPRSWRSMVYAVGFRNPFRFSLDPRSGVPYIGDVGWRTTEEINTLAPGTNAGWPCYEGKDHTTFESADVCQALYAAGSAQPPIWTYPHDGAGASVVGGVHYTGTSYPARYRNAFFFGDYSRQQLWTLETDPAGRLVRAPESTGFADRAGGPVAFRAGPNGDVTYADIISGKVRRLVYRDGNRAPVAQLTATTEAATRRVTFSGSDSYDLDADGLSYSWDLGDGSTANGVNVVHSYRTGDAVPVTLTVRDALGNSDTATATVYPANHTPELALSVPSPRSYAIGDVVQLAASASDSEDGPLAVSWETALLHCPFAGSCHRHPDSTASGPSYARTFTDHGSDTTMVVTASVEDSRGAVASASYEAKPALRTLAANSPVAVNINGVTAAAAQAVVGSRVQVDAPSTSSYRQFRSWSDQGARSHALTMPKSDLTLTAVYDTAIDAKYVALGGSSSFLGAATSSEYDVAGGRARNYVRGRLYWSADTGAHEVQGRILDKYRSAGGPAALGFPTTDEVAVTGGRASSFTKARIYWSSATGAHVSRGHLLAKYLQAGGPAGYGMPTTDDTKVDGGYYLHLTGGRSIYYSSTTGAHLVYGAIGRKYAAMGYQRSCLRFPTTDEYAITGGRANRFVGGVITYNSRTRVSNARC